MIYELVSGLHIDSTASRQALFVRSVNSRELPVAVELPQQRFLSSSVHELFWHIHCAVCDAKENIHRGNNRDKCCTKLFATENRLADPHILANLLEPGIRHYMRCNLRTILAARGVRRITAHTRRRTIGTVHC